MALCGILRSETDADALRKLSEFSEKHPIYTATVKPGNNDELFEAIPADEKPIKVKVGAYITSMDDFDYRDNTFSASFWVWFVYDKKYDNIINPHHTMETMDYVSLETVSEFNEVHGDKVWSGKRLRGVFKYNWNLSNYPADRQDLEIEIEEGDKGVNDIVYVADTENSGYVNEDGDGGDMPGWSVAGFEASTHVHTHSTNYGEPSAAPGSRTTYPVFSAKLSLERTSFYTFLKMNMVVLIASIVSWFSVLLKPVDGGMIAARVAILVAMIYSVALNIEYVDSVMGNGPLLTLPDKIQAITLASIMALLLVTILSFEFVHAGKQVWARRLDLSAFAVLPIVYAALLLLLVWK